MSIDDKTSDLQVGIVMGELKAGIDRLQRSGDRAEAAQVHILSALSTLQAEVSDLKLWRDALNDRPRSSSFTDNVEAVVEKANRQQSESIRVTALAAAEPVLLATQQQTKAVEAQTHVVASGIAQQTATLSKANKSGMVLMGVILGMWQLVQFLLGHH